MTSTVPTRTPAGADGRGVEGAGATRRPAPRRRVRPELVVAALWLVLVAPFVQALTAQGAPRFAMTGAIVDDGSLVIDDYLVMKDFTTRDGRTYSDKAPGQSVAAVPAYALARAVGAEPASVVRPVGNLTLWWVTVVCGGLPLVAIAALAASAIRRRGLTPSVPVLSGVVFGTMLLPLSSNLYGHVMAGALGYAAWWVLDGRRAGGVGGPVLAGALAGAAVATEYQVALVVAVLVAWLAIRRRWRDLGGVVLGGLPVAALLAAYQAAVTGSPVRSGYQTKSWEGEQDFFGTHLAHLPDPVQLVEVLVGTRGLLVFTPIVLLGVVGLVQRWRRERDDGAAVGLAALGALVLLQASWSNTWAGEGPGARYVAPALPFLAVGIADAWPRASTVVRRSALAVSVATMGLATVTNHLTPEHGLLGFYHLGKLLREGPTPTVLTIGLGRGGWVVHALLVVGLVAVVAAAARAADPPEPEVDRAP